LSKDDIRAILQASESWRWGRLLARSPSDDQRFISTDGQCVFEFSERPLDQDEPLEKLAETWEAHSRWIATFLSLETTYLFRDHRGMTFAQTSAGMFRLAHIWILRQLGTLVYSPRALPDDKGHTLYSVKFRNGRQEITGIALPRKDIRINGGIKSVTRAQLLQEFCCEANNYYGANVAQLTKVWSETKRSAAALAHEIREKQNELQAAHQTMHRIENRLDTIRSERATATGT
jgi:hypothetical protein